MTLQDATTDPTTVIGKGRDTASSWPPIAMHPAAPLVVLLASLVLIALAYWPMLGSGFLFDDFVNLVDNRAMHVVRLNAAEWVAAAFSSTSSSLARPLSMLTFAANHYFTGLDPMPMKMTNLSIHLLNTALVYLLALQLLAAARVAVARRAWIAVFCATCWGLMPINETVVLLTVQRMEALAQLFVLGGLIFYLRGRLRMMADGQGWQMVLAGIAGGTVLGVLAKESAALLPVYCLCAELLLFGFRTRDGGKDRHLIAMYVFCLILPAIAGLAWIAPTVLSKRAYAARDFTLGERVMTEWRVLVDYLEWTLLPRLSQLSLYHDTIPLSRGLLQPVSTLLSALVLGTSAIVAVFVRRHRPLTALGVAFFLSAHLMTATIIPLELVFEHRNYFASLGVCLVVADLLLVRPSTDSALRAGVAAALVICAGYGAISWIRASEWRDPVRFAISESYRNPTSPRATYELARTLIIAGNFKPDAKLAALTDSALAKARAANRGNILAVQASLIYAARRGIPADQAWWTEMQTRLRTGPIGPQELGALAALTKCATSRECTYPQDDMLNTYGAALQKGDNPEVLNLFASYAANTMNDPELAQRLWVEAIRLQPKTAQYRGNLIRLLIATDQFSAARKSILELRGLGKLGQTDAMADALMQELTSREAMRRRTGNHVE